MESLNPEQVSVVVQGPCGPYLDDVLESVRRHLPGAELILSSWEGTIPDGVDADRVIASEDPGSVTYWDTNGVAGVRMCNTNRMLRSTASGLAAATRPMAMKLRTDSILRSAKALQWWGRFEARHDQMAVFDERIVCISVAVRPGARSAAYLFHPSDCVHFGLTKDLVNLWATPEIDEEANVSFWLTRGGAGVDSPLLLPRYWNEQVPWLSCLERNGWGVDYPYAGALRSGLADVSDLSIVNNFTVLEPWQFGVSIPKLRPDINSSPILSYLWYHEWLAMYRTLASAANQPQLVSVGG